jgi:hypothetical protein
MGPHPGRGRERALGELGKEAHRTKAHEKQLSVLRGRPRDRQGRQDHGADEEATEGVAAEERQEEEHEDEDEP